MRKHLISLLLVVGLVCPSLCSGEDLKIGYVDIFQIFNEYDKTKDYDKVLEGERDKKEAELEKKKEEIKKMQDKLSLLKETEQDKERDKITQAATEYRDLEREALLDLKKKRDDKMKEIVEDINKVIEVYAQKSEFDLILNKSAVLYGEGGADVTDQILKIVNAKYKK